MMLSVLIPSRSEMFLARTIEDILEHSEAETEIIVVLDGEWSEPAIAQNPRVNVIYVPESVGQRAGTNLACKLARGRYIAKADAHCSFDQGFDRKMIEFMEKVGPDVTAVPVMKNLHAFSWNCRDCNWKKYQGPTPPKCERCGGTNLRRKMIWQPKAHVNSTSYCFDSEPHFQYHSAFKHTTEGKIGTVIGYKLIIDFSLLPSDSLEKVVANPVVGTKPASVAGIIKLLTDLASSHQFTVLPNSSGIWENVSTNTMGFSPINNGWGIGVQEISFIRDKTEMERIATLPILTDVVNYGYILASSSRNGTDEPCISETVCQGFLSELCAVSITPTINSSIENPTTRRTIHSDTLDKFNRILGGEFVYSEKRRCFHNGSVALIPIHSKFYTETMSLQGSFYMMTRKKYQEFAEGRDDLGSWGGEGIEIALKTWLAGSRCLVNHNTFYCHLFRTQGKDFSFPYPQSGREVSRTKHRVKDMFWKEGFKRQKYPVSWLVEKFWPVNGWTEEDLKKLKEEEFKP